jgi:predicted Zn-dependent protease with MMP-like domain
VSLDNPLTGTRAPVTLRETRIEYFRDCVEESVSRIHENCPEALRGVDIGIEPVPSPTAMWQGMVDHDAIPLAGAIDADPEQPARLVLYERPIERRALDRDNLMELVHHTLVEQLASLTGHSTLDIDPHFEDEW